MSIGNLGQSQDFEMRTHKILYFSVYNIVKNFQFFSTFENYSKSVVEKTVKNIERRFRGPPL